jgi:uncharacterized protein DUF6152
VKNKLFIICAAAVGAVVLSSPMFAHHSQTNYDMKRAVTLTGTVTEFEFVNPHVLIHFQVKDDNGQVMEWLAESGPPNNLRRQGLTKYTLKPGDEITVTIHPAKAGARAVHLQELMLNGKHIYTGERGEDYK